MELKDQSYMLINEEVFYTIYQTAIKANLAYILLCDV